jgi:hypothetical protein
MGMRESQHPGTGAAAAIRSLLDDAEFDVVHLNVDFPVLFGEVEASDHEPLVARFRLD